MSMGNLRRSLFVLLALTVSNLGLAANVLLIEDQGGFGGASAVLTGDGHTVTVINNEFANGYANLLNGAFLAGFDIVVWGARGAGSGNVTPAGVITSLESYIQAGGNLIVTGYDTIGSPTDTGLAGLVRSSTAGDQVSGDPNWTTAAVDNFILNGPYGDFRSLSFVATPYDDDNLTADGAAGAIALVTFPPGDRIIFTDLPGAGGSVGYWNGGLAGTVTNAQPDFSDGANPQDIFRNWVDGGGAIIITAQVPTNGPLSLVLMILLLGGTGVFLAHRRL